jgi:hypothetical protein
MHDRVAWPFFFAENNIMANIYLSMLQLFAFPQTAGTEEEEDVYEILFQQHSAPSHHISDEV